MTRRATRTRRSRIAILVFSSLVTLCLTAILAIALTPMVMRYVFLNRLDEADAELRKTGMVYVLRHAHEPQLKRALQKRLTDPKASEQLISGAVRALSVAGQWGPGYGGAWVRWLSMQAESGEADRKVAIAVQIAQAGLAGESVTSEPGLAALVESLLGHEDANVRYAALRARATMPQAGAAAAKLAQDTHPTIARLARIVQAIDSGADLAALARSLAVPSDEVIAAWRVALQGDVSTVLDLYRDPPAVDSADLIAAAAASRLAPHYLTDANIRKALDPIRWSNGSACHFRELAILENLPAGSVDLAIGLEMPDLVRAAAVRVAQQVSEDQWLNAFDSEHAGVRALVAMAAIQRLDRNALVNLAQRLNRTSYDNERMAGALLVGLAGLEPKMLEERLERETIWLVRQYVELGLLMLGRGTALDSEALLARREMPRESVVLALVHSGKLAGWDALFEPLSGDDGGVRAMLDQERLWPVIERYWPVDGPRFELWADQALQQAQVDILRTWYLMHRTSLSWDQSQKRWVRVAR